MRILIVSQYFWPESFRVNDLAAELIDRGHSVTVLSGYPNYPEGRIFAEFSSAPEQFSFFHGIEIVRVPLLARSKGSIRLMLNYLSFALSGVILGSWKLRGRQFDVIFAYEPSPITVGLPAIIMRKLKKAPLVFWVLDLWPETLEAIGAVRSKIALRWVGRLAAFIYNRCDLVLAQSKSFIPQIAKYCRRPDRIAYFPSWAETVFAPGNVAPAQEVSSQPGSFNVMFAGNIGEAQDFPSILAAANLLKKNSRIRWLIVGDGRMAAWVKAEIARLGLQEQVIMLGRHPVDRMPAFYKHADALLVSLKDEPIFAMTIPGKLQSYLAAGIPVVAMINGEGADIVERARAGVTCKAGDSGGLAAAVERLAAASASERDEMAHNAAAISRAEFDRQQLIFKLENWFVTLAAQGIKCS